MGCSLTHKSRWHPIFSQWLHFGRSVVVPNHIFNAYNYQINKVLVFKFYLIYFLSRNNKFRCFSNEMKKVKILVFLLWQKIITLSTTTFVLPNNVCTLSMYLGKYNFTTCLPCLNLYMCPTILCAILYIYYWLQYDIKKENVKNKYLLL
jgi:hypothetical protein